MFCNSKKTVDDLYDRLTAEGFTVSKIHSQMEQKEREYVKNYYIFIGHVRIQKGCC